MSQKENLIIKVDKGIERALKIFKKKFRDTKIMDETRDRKEYTKKSVKKRKVKQKAIYLNNKNKENS